jgi:hypothetical protein
MPLAHILLVFFDQRRLDDGGDFVNYHFLFGISAIIGTAYILRNARNK